MEKQEEPKGKEASDLTSNLSAQAMPAPSKKPPAGEVLPDDEFYGLGYNNRRSRLPPSVR